MDKKSFILYCDYKQHIDMLDRDGKADLLEYIFDYVNGEDVKPEGNASFVFSFVKAQLDRDDDKYNKFKEKQKVNGAKGGRPKKTQDKPNNPSLNSVTQKSLTDTVTVNDTVNDNVNNQEIKTLSHQDLEPREDDRVPLSKWGSTWVLFEKGCPDDFINICKSSYPDKNQAKEALKTFYDQNMVRRSMFAAWKWNDILIKNITKQKRK